MKSLRGRLLMGATISTLTVSALAGIAVYVLVRASLLVESDSAMVSKAAALASIAEVDEGKLKVEYDATQMPEYSRARDPEFFQIWLSGSDQTLKSSTIHNGELPQSDSRDRIVRKLQLPDGRPGRAISMAFPLHVEDEQSAAKSPPMAMITVAADIDELNERMSRLALLLLGVCGVATGVSLLATRIIVDRSLAPAADIAEKISRVGLADLKERIAAESSPKELVPIVERLNEMLGRLDAAFTRERAFTGNVAHELRTPLAGVKAALEVCLNQPRDPAEYRRVLGQCLAAVDLMHRMVESLLSITRLGSGQVALTMERIELAEMLYERWHMVQPADKPVHVEWDMPDDLAVEADRAVLRSVCCNLLDNAASYVDAGGAIHIATRAVSDRVELSISNTGNTLAPEDMSKVFEPFWRGDPSRTATGRHCGLGLTLTRGHVELMGGTMEVRSGDTGTFVVLVTLPRAQKREGESPAEPQSAFRRSGAAGASPSR